MNEDENAITVEHLSKSFKLPHEKQTTLKSAIISFRKRRKFEIQHALQDLDFEIKKGEFFGIVGRNGSGKSTLLKLLAGIYAPTTGSIQVNGKLTPFIELGVGFNPELTGKENVFLNGALLGFNRKEMNNIYQDIVDFAELERFMDQKLKNYSSGMQVRLAFSIAIRAESDILLIDEVLAVGDAAFQSKCFDYFRVLKKRQKTVVFVSHDRGAIENFCDRCILIEGGHIQLTGKPMKILKAYNEITLEQILESESRDDKSKIKADKNIPHITHDMEIISATCTKDGKHNSKFIPGEKITINVTMKANKTTEDPVYGLVVQREGDPPALATNTRVRKMKTGTIQAGQTTEVVYEFDNIFGNGTYQVTPAIASKDAAMFYDWQDALLSFHSSGWNDTYTALHPPHKIKLVTAGAKHDKS